MHYSRLSRHKDIGPTNRIRECNVDGCIINDCQRPYYGKGYCRYHYDDLQKARCIINDCLAPKHRGVHCQHHYYFNKKYGDPLHESKIGKGFIDEYGYRLIFLNGEQVREHRAVMEQYLGRNLLPNENVHHENGVRDDNRIDNLEIWNTSQPAGQRPEDKLLYAKEIISIYERNLFSSIRFREQSRMWFKLI